MKIINDVLNVQEDSGEGLRQGKRTPEQPEACNITHVVVVHEMDFHFSGLTFASLFMRYLMMRRATYMI